MATISFDRKLVVKDKKAVDILHKGLSVKADIKSTIVHASIDSELERGRKALARYSCRSRKSY